MCSSLGLSHAWYTFPIRVCVCADCNELPFIVICIAFWEIELISFNKNTHAHVHSGGYARMYVKMNAKESVYKIKSLCALYSYCE